MRHSTFSCQFSWKKCKVYIFQRHMIHCNILLFTYTCGWDSCKANPWLRSTLEFKHACLVFGKRAFVFSDTVESNRNIARSFLSSWESFFSTWRKGPSGFSAWRKSSSDVPIALNDVSDVPIAFNDVRWMMERVLSYQYMYLTHVLKKLQLELNFNIGSHRTIHLVYIWYFIEELTTKSKEWKRNVALKLMTRACI